MSSARAAVLRALSDQPDPVGIDALAKHMGRHPNTVREHASWLVEQGYASRTPEPIEGRGRPGWLYSALDTGPQADDYAELAASLAWTIAQGGGDVHERAIAAGRHWGEHVAQQQQLQPQPTAKAGRAQVVELMQVMGYEPEADARIDKVPLRRCPLLQVASDYQQVVCTVHLGLVQAALEVSGADPERAELTPFTGPSECQLRLLAPKA